VEDKLASRHAPGYASCPLHTPDMHSDGKTTLIRTVGFWGLVLMCINAVIGSGVFLLPHESFVLLGPFSLWAPLLFAIPVFILVLCFAEAASHFDQPGGAYLYAKTAFGDFVGFQTGWMNWLARVTSLASLSVGFVVALGMLFPSLQSGLPRAMVLISLIGVLAVLHIRGIRHGAASIYVLTLGKLLPLLGFIVVALCAWKNNPIPESLAFPARGTNWTEAALFMLFLYAGFENLGVPAGEFRNPRRHLPAALLIGTIVIALIYVLAQLATMSVLVDLSHTSTPVAAAAAQLVGDWGAWVITVGALLSMAGTNSGTVLEGSRMLYVLGRDRGLPMIAYIHPRFRTPTVAISIHAGLALTLTLWGTFRELALLSTVARLATYLATCLAVPRLRRLNEGFRTPGKIVPILGTLVSLTFVFSLDRKRIIAASLALGVGAVSFLCSRASKARRETA
jgi:basic amino acid/polyamine antiporter, APA family